MRSEKGLKAKNILHLPIAQLTQITLDKT